MNAPALARRYSDDAVRDPATMIRDHSGLVRKIAWHVHARVSSAVEIEDLIQIGLVALVEAANGFEDRGIAFGPYASLRIRGAMIDQLRREARLFRSGMANRRKLAAVRKQIENALCRSASDAEMAVALDMTPDTYFEFAASARAAEVAPIDDAYSDHDPAFIDARPDPETLCADKDERAMLTRHIGDLPEREAMILQLYFVEELNLDEIGATMGIGAARVCQIKKAALARLHAAMTED